MGDGTYQGWPGGLYEGGETSPPADLLATAIDTARGLAPIDGAIVFVSIGMSNTTMEFSAFIPLAEAYPDLNPDLVLVDGAQGSQPASAWVSPDAPTWQEVDRRLAVAGVGPDQVLVAWVKQAEAHPSALGGFPAHAEALEADLETIAANLSVRYPNIRLAYFSSRTRAYTDDAAGLNPEPFAFESAFSVQSLVQRSVAGEIASDTPLLLWGPYLWADGTNPRADGFVWNCEDVRNTDFTHPSESGQAKVADLLLDFFSTDPTATPWFTASGDADSDSDSDSDVDADADADVDADVGADADGDTAGCGCRTPTDRSAALPTFLLGILVLARRRAP